MKNRTALLLLGSGLLSFLFLAGCSLASRAGQAAQGEQAPSPSAAITAAVSRPLTPTPTGADLPVTPAPAVVSPINTPATMVPSSTPANIPAPCATQVCIVQGTFLFQRPIAPPGRNTVDTSYRFGDNDGGIRDVHHGVEFLNPYGTPVLAVGDGSVVVAGDDKKVIYGTFPNAYGNLVVIQHSLPGISQPVFTVYGHLSKIDVKVGDVVTTGQKVGEVGAAGAATGPHLHFEVRLGENTYAASRNPELWLVPLSDEQGQLEGGIAGSILDANGNQISIPNIVITPVSDSTGWFSVYVHTYQERKLVGEAPWQESFAAGGLSPGEYKISFVRNGMQTLTVMVQPGELTLVTFKLPQ